MEVRRMMTGNIMDYLEWYGDFDFSVMPFNEVDNLILAELSYASLDGIVPEPQLGRKLRSISVKEAALKLDESGRLEKSCKLERNAGLLLLEMAKGRRFADAVLAGYVDKHDFENQEQFSALHVYLSDGTLFVSYSGTDDTILGWKEDLNMAYQMPVPSQEEAVGYLEKTVPHDGRLIRIGGHSKGGNLAIYAAAMCYDRLKRRIIAIYNNDGPGFLESMLEKKAYLEIKDKVRTIVPETSIIGMLLEHGDSYEVVKSTGKGIMQHDGLNWQVYRNGFVKLDERSKESLVIDKTISAWVMGLSDDERVAFVDAVYDMLTRAGVNYLSDLEKYKPATLNSMAKEMFSMEPEKGRMVRRTIRALISEYGKNVVKGMRGIN
ncbi:MAG TPA: hypothetical protein DCR91_09595 [Eubacterium sp.]|jgi:hypothetical protein|nr:hypothetical protein [Eubacterium sp.]HAZ86272.1 hypothetical protein [Eubacterium sp.]